MPLFRLAQARFGPAPPDLLADEPVLHGHDVVRERLPVEEVAELSIEGAPVVVAHLEQAILHAERVVEVLAEGMAGEFDVPAFQVFAVEQLNPLPLLRIVLGHVARRTLDPRAPRPSEEQCEHEERPGDNPGTPA